MSAPYIDVRGALEAAGIKYKTSGRWTRARAEWRNSKDYNIAISETGGWHDHTTGDHGRWGELCERLGIYSQIRPAAWRAPVQARVADDLSDRVRRANVFWSLRKEGRAHESALLAARGRDIINPAAAAGVRIGEAWHDGQNRPCLVWPIYNLGRSLDNKDIIGVQREWGRGHKNKRMLGRHIIDGVSGGFIIPATTGSDTLYIVEGPITGCAVATATGCAVLVLFDTSGLRAVPLSVGGKAGGRIIIAADNDKSGAGLGAAHACATRLLLHHPKAAIKITMPPEVGTDWADILERDGAGAVRTALAAGLQDPPPPPTPPGGRVIPLVPWEKVTPTPPLHEIVEFVKAEQSVLAAVRGWAVAGTPLPTIVRVTPGVGKTHRMIETISASDKPFLILCPTLDQAREVAAQIPGARLHVGRNEKNCKKFVTVAALTERRRAPHAHACLTCAHGPDDSDDPCEYMPALRASVYSRVVVAAHGAGAEDSLLYSHCPDPAGDVNAMIDRRIACDESPAVNVETKIQATHITEWRSGVVRAGALLNAEEVRIKGEIQLAERFDQDTGNAQGRLAAIEKARAWVHGIAPELDGLALALAAAPAERGLHPITGLKAFTKFATKIPRGARHLDATLIESVDLRHAQAPVIPLKAIETLGVALTTGTAFFEQGAVVCMNTGSFWKQIIKRGGLLLDATPSVRQVAEVEAVGGTVVTVRAAQENLHIIQIGPRLHGRGGLRNGGAEREAAAFKRLGAESAAITHKPVRDLIDDPNVRHWGVHRAFNDWKDQVRLVLYGLPLLSPRDQRLQYLADRAALAAVGVEWADWDGSAEAGQVVEIDGWRVRSAARLPSVPDARAWLLDRLAADVAQAIGRLRAVRRTEPVTVEIYGLLPLVGHGIKIDEFRHERQGRAADNLKTRTAVAAGVINMGEHLTRAKLSDFVLRKCGRRISNTTLDCTLDEIKAAALARGITLAQACAALIGSAEQLLGKHGGDAGAALQEVAGRAPATELLLWACAHEPLADEPRAAQGP